MYYDLIGNGGSLLAGYSGTPDKIKQWSASWFIRDSAHTFWQEFESAVLACLDERCEPDPCQRFSVSALAYVFDEWLESKNMDESFKLPRDKMQRLKAGPARTRFEEILKGQGYPETKNICLPDGQNVKCCMNMKLKQIDMDI